MKKFLKALLKVLVFVFGVVPLAGCILLIALGVGFEAVRVSDRGQCEAATSAVTASHQQTMLLKQGTDLHSAAPTLSLTPITATNTERIVELERLGHGFIRDAFWGSDERLYVLTSVGLWRDTGLKPDTLIWHYETEPQRWTLSPNQSWIALDVAPTWNSDEITILRVSDGQVLMTPQFEGGVLAVAFNQQETELAISTSSMTYRWNLVNGKPITSVQGGATALAFSPDGNLLAAGATIPDNRTGFIRLVDLTQGEIVARIITPDAPEALAFSPDGTLLASSGNYYRDKNVYLWDVQSGHQIASWRSDFDYAAIPLFFSPDGQFLLHGTRVYDVEARKYVTSLEGSLGRFNLDGTLVVTTSRFSPRPMNWRTKNFKPFMTGSDNAYQAFSFGELRFDADHYLYGLPSDEGPQASADGNLFALVEGIPGNSDGGTSIRLCNGKEQRQITVLDGGSPIAYSQDNASIAITDYCKIRILNAATGEVLKELSGCAKGLEISSMAFSADGSILVVALSSDRQRKAQLQIWDLNTQQLLSTLKGPTQGVTAIMFRDDDQVMATASLDGTIRLWGIPQ